MPIYGHMPYVSYREEGCVYTIEVAIIIYTHYIYANLWAYAICILQGGGVCVSNHSGTEGGSSPAALG
jgi:hypothetical protein